MVRKIFYLVTVLLAAVHVGHAQDAYTERAKKYVEQYYTLAIAEQRTSGIPASITLGQGILETEAGASELMVMANNHFGIKCKNGWDGPTFLHTDDAKDECFKKYASAAESYKDHSAHLIRNPRYAPLFKCSKTDYAAWAVGLKKCGYATNPQYAKRLIQIIEDFKLQEYTYAALDTSLLSTYPALVDESPLQAQGAPPKNEYVVAHDSSSVKEPVKMTVAAAMPDTVKKLSPADTFSSLATITGSSGQAMDSVNEELRHKKEQEMIHAAASSDTSKVIIVNGLKAFFAHKDEILLEYAVKYSVRYPHLLEMNDLTDAPLPFDMYVYLEKKLTSGTHDKHTVKEGENLLMIAQEEGMQLKRLTALNLLVVGEEPMPGTVLELQSAPGKKPLVKLLQLKAHRNNAIETGSSAVAADSIVTYKAPVYNSLGGDTTTVASAARQEATVSYGASFAPPADNADPAPAKKIDDKDDFVTIDRTAKSSAQKTEKSVVMNATAHVAKQDTPAKQDLSGLKARLDKSVYQEPQKTVSMKDDPSQPQLKKPATEKEYKKGDKFYIVKRGDTAYSISKNHDITVAQLLKWNDTEPQDIKAGQTLRIKQ